jgi:hypothetical protein
MVLETEVVNISLRLDHRWAIHHPRPLLNSCGKVECHRYVPRNCGWVRQIHLDQLNPARGLLDHDGPAQLKGLPATTSRNTSLTASAV